MAAEEAATITTSRREKGRKGERKGLGPWKKYHRERRNKREILSVACGI